MATRFYAPRWDGRAAAVSPAFGSQWERTTNAFRRLAPITKGATVPTSTTGGQFTKDGAAANYDVAQFQFISDPISAQTISGTFSAVFKAGESVATADASLQIVLRVVSNDGLTERGVLYAGHAAALNTTAGALGQEMATSAATRIFNAVALSSVAALANDRIVIEVGSRFHGTNTAVNSFILFGDNSGTADYALTAALTTTLCPWVEFSANITFATDLVVAGAAQAQVADNVTLTQVHSLAVAAAVQAQIADNVTVTEVAGATTLVVADAGQAQVADTVTLTQVHALAVAGAAQAQVADTISLTQVHSLAVAAASQTQTADAPVLTQVHSLVVAGAVQTQTADNVTVTAVAGETTLTVANATQAQTADSVSLTQVHALVISSALHDHVAGSVSLTQNHVLGVQSATQSQAADNVVLDAGAIDLVVASAVHAQIANSVTLGGPGERMPLNTHELPLAQLLLECLEEVLTVDHPNPPLHFSLRVGQVAFDLSEREDLCCEGLAYVKINSAYPSDNFPEPTDTYSPCGGGGWAADLEMGVLRCAPVGTLEYMPTDEDWTAAAEQVAHDAAALRQAVACFRDRLDPTAPWVARAWAPIGAEGGCTGGSQVVTVGFINSLC